MNSERSSLFTFVHLEKTAGTTVSQTMANLLGPNAVFRYITSTGKFIRFSGERIQLANPAIDKLKQVFATSLLRPFLTTLYQQTTKGFLRPTVYDLDNLPEEAKAIFGHFTLEIVENQNIKPKTLALLVRNPFERMYSHYLNWQRSNGKPEWRINLNCSTKISFEEFAFLKELQNYQSQVLSGYSLSDFSLLGTTENLAHFLQEMHSLFIKLNLIEQNLPLPNLPAINVTPKKPNISVNENFIKKFEKFHKEDYQLYNAIS